MLEHKIVKLANGMYRAVIRLSLRSVNARDKRALKALDKAAVTADHYREAALNLREQASKLEDESNANYSIKSRQIMASYNALQNALDDSEILL